MSQTLDHASSPATQLSKPIELGTLGWTELDLDDPQLAAFAADKKLEIIHGVLTLMPPAYFKGSRAAFELLCLIRKASSAGNFASEVDIVLADDLVLQADYAWLTNDDWAKHLHAAQAAGRPDPGRTRLLIPPTLVLESISPGHAAHDRVSKFRWYAEFGVSNYWIIDGFARRLDCYHLRDTRYERVAGGSEDETITLPMFSQINVDLKQLWL